MKAKGISLAFIFATLSAIIAWRLRFHPFGAKALTNPSGTHRILAEARGLDAVVVLLRASDWPYTFFEPRMLHAVTEDRESTGNYYLTHDESVILHLVKREDGSTHYAAAYDFREHRILNQATTTSESECNMEIEKLAKERGGLGSLLTGLPDGKNYR